MPAWIHDRAEHILAKNPKMEKGTAFAVATQQAHKLGKTPKGYGTAEGKRTAKAKLSGPKKGYVKGANPGKLDSPKLKESSVRQAAKNFPYKRATGAVAPPLAVSQHGRTKESYAVSDYSGPLTMGSFKQESSQPPFVSPRVKTSGPPSKRKAASVLEGVVARMDKLAAPAMRGPQPIGMSAPGIQTKGPQLKFSPTKQFNASRKVGNLGPKPPGPSIHQTAGSWGQPTVGTVGARNAGGIS